MEAAGLPALIPAAALPQVNAEDLPWSATIKQHRDLEQNKEVFEHLRNPYYGLLQVNSNTL